VVQPNLYGTMVLKFTGLLTNLKKGGNSLKKLMVIMALSIIMMASTVWASTLEDVC